MLNRDPKNDGSKNKLTFPQQNNSTPVGKNPSYNERMYFLFRKKLKLREIDYMPVIKQRMCIVTFAPTQSFRIVFEDDYIRVNPLYTKFHFEVLFHANTIEDLYRKLYRFRIITIEQLKVLILDKPMPKVKKFKGPEKTRSQYLDEKIEEYRKSLKK